jgi:type IV secretory pathway TraG/TraD family ATPase VirD4
MQKSEMFEGNQLYTALVPYALTGESKCAFLGDSYNVHLDMDILSKHIMFLGGIGTGKTNAFSQIIAQLRRSMNADDIMIIFDTKGDFYRAFYKQGDIVISNDQTATGANDADYWNIFNEIDINYFMASSIIEISKTLFQEKLEKTQQPFFPNAAKDLLCALLTHFMRTENMQRNNKGFKDFLDYTQTAEIREILKGHNDFRAMVSYIADDRSPQTQGVISELQQLSREIFIENFAQEGTISMKKLIHEKGGKIIFIEYDLARGRMLSPIYSLLFDLAIKEALGREEGSKGNVYFITDEFNLLPNLQHIDDAVNFGRSLGVKFMIGLQNIDQAFDSYGEERARSLLSGFLTSVAFRVNDPHSRQYIKELHGKNRKKETFLSSVHAKGLNESIREANVVEDWDISNLGIGEAIIGLPGKEPFKFRFKKM